MRIVATMALSAWAQWRDQVRSRCGDMPNLAMAAIMGAKMSRQRRQGLAHQDVRAAIAWREFDGSADVATRL
eukprot:11890558-Alexandrium_andersonii.AAC.1